MNILLCAGINKANQYIELLCEAYQRCGHSVILGVDNFFHSDFMPDIVHLQWPEALYDWNIESSGGEKSLKVIEEHLLKYSKKDIPIVYTVHNYLPHDNFTTFYQRVYSIIYRFSNIIIHHGRASILMLQKEFPECTGAKHVVCPHGPYPYTGVDGKLARLTYQLPPEKYIFLNFGLQRPYKGASFIQDVFSSWSDKSFLFVIGPKIYHASSNSLFEKLNTTFKQKMAPYVGKAISALSKNRKIVLRSVPQDEIPRIMAAADVLFLGHKNGLNSGLLSLAATYGKPVVFPDIGNFKEQLKNWPWQESYEVGNIESAIEALKRIRLRINSFSPANLAFDNNSWLKSNSWDKHVNRIIMAINSC